MTPNDQVKRPVGHNTDAELQEFIRSELEPSADEQINALQTPILCYSY